MQVHLIRSPEYGKERFDELVLFLERYKGPVQFLPVPSFDPASKRKRAKVPVVEDQFFKQEFALLESVMACRVPDERWVDDWESLFRTCNIYRKRKRLGEDVPVLLLTEVANEHNWFCSLDPGGSANGFVHTGEWEHYIRCSEVFPVAYLAASLLLKRHMFRDHHHFQGHVHQSPLGCMNDFCRDKKEILLKLRTADICYDCMQLLKGTVDVAIVEQVLRIFEGVRSGMLFHQNFRQNLKPSILRISGSGRFYLEDYQKELVLYPLEKTLYLFFLQHPEGVALTHLVDFKEELKSIYFRFTTAGTLPAIQKSINDLVNVNSGSVVEKITKINRKLRDAIGEELAKHYAISGERGEARCIRLERSYVVDGFER